MEPRPPARTVCLWKGHTEGPHVRAEETWRRGTAGGGTRSLQSPCSTGTVTLWETLTQTKLLPGSPVRGQRGPRRCADSFHGQVLLTHHRLFTDPLSQQRTQPGHPLRARRWLVHLLQPSSS